jgi:hypothetical protein
MGAQNLTTWSFNGHDAPGISQDPVPLRAAAEWRYFLGMFGLQPFLKRIPRADHVLFQSNYDY